MYILLCSNGTYYTGSTNNLTLRLKQHWTGKGANHTKKFPPEEVLYVEEYPKVWQAYKREKQIQGWRREKKTALIEGRDELLPELAIAYRDKTTLEDMTPR